MLLARRVLNRDQFRVLCKSHTIQKGKRRYTFTFLPTLQDKGSPNIVQHINGPLFLQNLCTVDS